VNTKVVTWEYPTLVGTRQTLVKRVGDGSIITRFERTPIPSKSTDVVCPHFLELKWANGCPFDCSWCYLKGTLRFRPEKAKPRIKDFAKIEQHVRSFIDNSNGHAELLNTGELSDSLMYERNGNPFSKFILSLFEGQERNKVLFLTKSKNIQHLLENDYTKNAVVSFSINAHCVANKFERRAPAVEKRIQAASELAKAGYEVRIRIDPMVPVRNWEQKYRDVVDDIFSQFIPSRVTLGSLRGLQSTINNATDKSWVAYLSENSNWGKRIEANIRFLMYREVIDYLKETHNYTNVALCKETLEIWDKLGMDYRSIKCNCVL
jgi:spore photoproduct lyase